MGEAVGGEAEIEVIAGTTVARSRVQAASHSCNRPKWGRRTDRSETKTDISGQKNFVLPSSVEGEQK